jgi:hypothetical protein
VTTRQTRRIRVNGKEFLAAGLNVTDNALLVPPNEMTDADDILVGSTLARKKRGGQAYFNTDDEDAEATYPSNPKNTVDGVDGDPILGKYEFWRHDATTGLPHSTLLVRQGTKIWAIEGRTGAAVDITGSLTLPNGGTVTFQAFEGKVFWAGTGVAGTEEGLNVWDGDITNPATAAATEPPDGTPKYILAHGGRMWAWGVPGFPYRLYYSEFYDAEVWATAVYGDTGTAAEAGSLDMDPFGDPVGINGGVSYQDRLYIFMRRARFEITGSTINDFFVKTLSRQVGCIGHHTIVSTGEEVFYASERGVTTLASSDTAIQNTTQFVGRNVSKIWNRMLNRTRYDQYSAAYDEQEGLYLLTVPSAGSSVNDTILVYNVESRFWVGVWRNHKARCLTTYIVEGINRVISGREDGIIALLGESSLLDLGQGYSARFKTGMLYPGEEIDIEHIWKHVTLLAAAEGTAQLVINAYVDSKKVHSTTLTIESDEAVLGAFVLGESSLGSGVFVPKTVPLKGQGYGVQLEVIYNGENDIEVFGFIVEAMPAGSPVGGNR